MLLLAFIALRAAVFLSFAISLFRSARLAVCFLLVYSARRRCFVVFLFFLNFSLFTFRIRCSLRLHCVSVCVYFDILILLLLVRLLRIYIF